MTLPNPCCCTECVIYHDAYTTDSIATDWDEISGSWSIAGGILSIEDTAALLIANEPHPDGDYQPQVVRVRVRFDTAGDIARLIIAYDDTDNYLFVEFWIGGDGCGHVQMYERIAGVNTELGDEYALPFEIEVDTWTTVSLCYLPGDTDRLTTRISHTNGVWAESVEPSPDLLGDQGGLGTGATVAGTIDFDDFDYLYHYDEVDHPTCPECAGNTSCTLHEDGFDRSNTTDVGCAWEEVSGDWEIDGNELTIAEADAIIRNRTQHPDSRAQVYIQFDFRCEAGAIIKAILDYEDDDNYFFVQLEPGSHGDSGRVTFWRRTAGVDTQIPHTSVLVGLAADTEDNFTIKVCWLESGVVRVFLDGPIGSGITDSFTTVLVSQEAAEPYVGLGTGAGGSAQVWFDDFRLIRTTEEIDSFLCRECTLQNCGLVSDSAYDGDLWTVEAGSWDYTPDLLNVGTASSAAMLLNATGHPQTTGEGFLDLTSAALVELTTEDYGNIARVLIGVEDADNYLYAEIEWAADDESPGYVRVGKVEAGVDTEIDETETSVLLGQPGIGDNPSLLRVCYDGLELKAEWRNYSSAAGASAGLIVAASGEAGTGWNPGYSGIATGTLAAGSVFFGQFVFYHDIFSAEAHPYMETCHPCGNALTCALCCENDADDEGACLDRSPQIVLLRLSGIAQDPSSVDYCDEIAQFNDTFALPFYSTNGVTECQWLMFPHFCDSEISSQYAQIRFMLTRDTGFIEMTADLFVYDPDTATTPYGFASIHWEKILTLDDIYDPSLNIDEVPAEQVCNTDCLDEPADEDNWGFDCLEYLTDWYTIAEGEPGGSFYVTGTNWLLDATLTAKAEVKVLV